MAKRKNPAAVALAKRRMVTMTKEQRKAVSAAGAHLGGKARARNLTAAERRAIAKRAAAARWGKKNDR
jgi:hypothetical protein